MDTHHVQILLGLWEAGAIGWPAETIHRYRELASFLSVQSTVARLAGGRPRPLPTMFELIPESREIFVPPTVEDKALELLEAWGDIPLVVDEPGEGDDANTTGD